MLEPAPNFACHVGHCQVLVAVPIEVGHAQAGSACHLEQAWRPEGAVPLAQQFR